MRPSMRWAAVLLRSTLATLLMMVQATAAQGAPESHAQMSNDLFLDLL